VHVVVDEAGHREAAAEVDDARARRRIRIDGGDAVPFDRDGRREAVARPDPSVPENEQDLALAFLDLGREVVLQADLLDEAELCFEPVDVLFLVVEDLLEEVAAVVVSGSASSSSA
jgi:hypothetical protein